MSHPEELSEAIEEIKHVLRAISILQSRALQFKKELDYYNKNEDNLENNQVKKIGMLMRLSDEVRLLCIDTYSLYEGIAKKKSLYSKVIRQKAKALSKIDNSPVKNLIHLEVYEKEGHREATEKEKEETLAILTELAIEEAKNTRDTHGIKSTNHSDLDKWLDSIVDDELITKLGRYRSDFAHYLNSLEKLKKALSHLTLPFIQEVLKDILKILDKYNIYLKKIISYANSEEKYNGISNFIYSSLSAEMQSARLLPIIEYYKKKQS